MEIGWWSGKKFTDGISRIKDTNEEYYDNVKDYFNIKFLGYVVQQYTAKTVDGERRPVHAYERIINDIPNAVNRYILKELNQVETMEYALGEIPNFNSIVPLSQRAHKAMFMLSYRDGIVGAHFSKVLAFEKIISEIAERVLKNIEKIGE